MLLLPAGFLTAFLFGVTKDGHADHPDDDMPILVCVSRVS